MKSYWALQVRMINRKFKDAGFEPLLAVFILVAGFIVFSWYLFSKTSLAAYIYVLLALSLTGNLSAQRRTEFLKICFGDKALKKIRLTENLLCTLPFIIFLLIKQCFIPAASLLALSTLTALVHFRTPSSVTIWTPFSKKPFEFTTGFRNTFYIILGAYILTGIALWVNNFNLGVFALLLVFAICSGYYTTTENEYYVWIYPVPAKTFLLKKIQTGLLFSAALAFPPAIALALFYVEHLGLLLLFVLCGWAFLIAMIVTKYSAYPGEINIPQAVLLALCVLFPPLLLILIPYLFKQSKNRLNRILQ